MSTQQPAIARHTRVDTAVVPIRQVAVDDLTAAFDAGFGELIEVLTDQGTEIAGPAFAHYVSPPADRFDLDIGMPVASPVQASGRVRAAELPDQRVARLVHHGGYDGLSAAWARLTEWVAEQGLPVDPAAGWWEVYVTEPSPEADPADMRTELNLPLLPEA